MREATAEQATIELQKATDDVHILAQYNIARKYFMLIFPMNFFLF